MEIRRPEAGWLPTLSLTALAKDWLPNTKSDVYYFFFAAFFFAGFAFVAFFFVALLGLLNGPSGWRPLASSHPVRRAALIAKTTQRISHTLS